jgi:hypothetical protein
VPSDACSVLRPAQRDRWFVDGGVWLSRGKASELSSAGPSLLCPRLRPLLTESPNHGSARARNIVATVNLDCRLDLKTIALHARNAEYNPKVRLVASPQLRPPLPGPGPMQQQESSEANAN